MMEEKIIPFFLLAFRSFSIYIADQMRSIHSKTLNSNRIIRDIELSKLSYSFSAQSFLFHIYSLALSKFLPVSISSPTFFFQCVWHTHMNERFQTTHKKETKLDRIYRVLLYSDWSVAHFLKAVEICLFSIFAVSFLIIFHECLYKLTSTLFLSTYSLLASICIKNKSYSSFDCWDYKFMFKSKVDRKFFRRLKFMKFWHIVLGPKI